jgi:hypothetical protein
LGNNNVRGRSIIHHKNLKGNMKSNHYLHSLMLTVIALVLGSFPVRGDVLYQSATLGPIGQTAGDTLSSSQYLGARFSLNNAVQVQAIGGNMYDIDGGSLFGAIFPISGPNAMPSGSPFDVAPLAEVTFTLPIYADADVSIPLSVELQPGNYALIFGSGQFGATGVGAMPTDNPDIPGQTPFFGWWNNQWNNDSVSNMRFVVYGAAVPEPGTFTLFAIASGAIALLRLRRKTLR